MTIGAVKVSAASREVDNMDIQNQLLNLCQSLISECELWGAKSHQVEKQIELISDLLKSNSDNNPVPVGAQLTDGETYYSHIYHDQYEEWVNGEWVRCGYVPTDLYPVDQMDSKRNEIASLKNCILNLVRQKNTAKGKIDKAYLILSQDNSNNFNTLMRKIDGAKDALKGN